MTERDLELLLQNERKIGVIVHDGRGDIVYSGDVQSDNGNFYVQDGIHGKLYIAPGMPFRTKARIN